MVHKRALGLMAMFSLFLPLYADSPTLAQTEESSVTLVSEYDLTRAHATQDTYVFLTKNLLESIMLIHQSAPDYAWTDAFKQFCDFAQRGKNVSLKAEIVNIIEESMTMLNKYQRTPEVQAVVDTFVAYTQAVDAGSVTLHFMDPMEADATKSTCSQTVACNLLVTNNAVFQNNVTVNGVAFVKSLIVNGVDVTSIVTGSVTGAANL